MEASSPTQTTTLARLLASLDPDEVRYEGCGPDTEVAGLEVDSRQIGPGQAFLAVAGVESDGHRYLSQARAAGARVLIVQDDQLEGRWSPDGGPLVRLRSSARALPLLAGEVTGWPGRSLRLAGVTGTNGKTTTTYFVDAALRAAGRRFARIGTTGHWLADRPAPTGYTTPFPLELQRLLATAVARGATDAVMEVSSHGLEQDRVAPLRFAAVALTSFSQDHLDYHATMEAYLEAKLRLASHYGTPGGVAVAPVAIGAPATRFLDAARAAGLEAWPVSVGDAPGAIRARRVTTSAEGSRAEVDTPAGTLELRTALVGDYNLHNALVAVGLGLGLGLPLQAIGEGIAAARAPGRLERVEVPGVAGPAVFVDYAHTPDAVARALAALRPAVRGELWVVLGCGGDRDPTKRPRMGEAAARGSDRFFATSDNPRTEDPAQIVDQMVATVADQPSLVREVDRAAAIARAVAEASEHDTLLIAGKGHEDYQVLGTTRIDFDDREHARRALEARRG